MRYTISEANWPRCMVFADLSKCKEAVTPREACASLLLHERVEACLKRCIGNSQAQISCRARLPHTCTLFAAAVCRSSNRRTQIIPLHSSLQDLTLENLRYWRWVSSITAMAQSHDEFKQCRYLLWFAPNAQLQLHRYCSLCRIQYIVSIVNHLSANTFKCQ